MHGSSRCCNRRLVTVEEEKHECMGAKHTTLDVRVDEAQKGNVCEWDKSVAELKGNILARVTSNSRGPRLKVLHFPSAEQFP